MGRKKKKQSKPWCWYCNREFDDEKILIQHQKAKHFKCHICHKKLYTGPGLSIHCMQVHKETIDKVPNSLPSRGNIEIEIYGMEGIPEADIKAHESSRGLEDDDEGPVMKRAKSDSPAMQTPPGPQAPPGLLPGVPGVPGLPPGMTMAGPMQIPGMPPGVQLQGQIRPAFGLQWGVQVAPPQPGPVQYSGRPTGPNGQPTGPAKPLFPAASGAPPSSQAGPVGADFKPLNAGARPTFPAYGGERNGEEAEKKPALIATAGANSRIVHPPEDISLEERRAAMPKYQANPPISSGQPPHPQHSAAMQILPGQPGVMVAASSPVPQPGQPPLMHGGPMVGQPMMPPQLVGGPLMPPGAMVMGDHHHQQPQQMGLPQGVQQPGLPMGTQLVMSSSGPMLVQSSPQMAIAGAQPMMGNPMLQQLQRPGLMQGMPGMPGMPGGIPGMPGGAPMQGMPGMGIPGMVASQPQVMLARPPMLGIPSQQAMFGGPVMVGGIPHGLAPQLQQPGAPFGMIGMPRFR